MIFAAQVESRVLDHTARWLRAQGHGYYTIGSAGHESNAAVAAALRPTDPALLHYRSGGFYCARARQSGAARCRRRRARRDARARRGTDRRRAAQGVRAHRPGGHPPDVDDRVPSAPCARCRVRDRPGAPARPRDPLAERCARRVLVRRRERQPLHRTRCDQRRVLHRPRRSPGAVAVRVRGQRVGDQRADAAGLDRGDVRHTTRSAVRAGRRHGSARRVRDDRAGWPPTSARPVGRRCCTCARCATSATRAPTSRRATVRLPRCDATTRPIRSSRPPARWCPQACAHLRGWSASTGSSGVTSGRVRSSCSIDPRSPRPLRSLRRWRHVGRALSRQPPLCPAWRRARPCVRRSPARGRGSAHARRDDQSHARRRPRGSLEHARVR